MEIDETGHLRGSDGRRLSSVCVEESDCPWRLAPALVIGIWHAGAAPCLFFFFQAVCKRFILKWRVLLFVSSVFRRFEKSYIGSYDSPPLTHPHSAKPTDSSEVTIFTHLPCSPQWTKVDVSLVNERHPSPPHIFSPPGCLDRPWYFLQTKGLLGMGCNNFGDPKTFPFNTIRTSTCLVLEEMYQHLHLNLLQIFAWLFTTGLTFVFSLFKNYLHN